MKRCFVALAVLVAVAASEAGSLPKSVVGRVTSACVLVQAAKGDQGQAGSGFFVGRSEVLTNHHVVKAAVEGDARVVVIVDSGTKSRKVVEATILGADEDLDLALLRVKHKSSTFLRFLRESQLRVTEAVWVAGYPFGTQPGLEVTVTAGTVTSLRRDEEGELRQVQIDASINPGNSGGPVVNGRGQVVGVTRAVVSPKVGAGMAIAIPCGAAQDFVRLAQKTRHRAAALRLKGRTSRRGLRILRAEKVEEAGGVTVQLHLRGSRTADEAESFAIEVTDRRRTVLKRQDVAVDDLEPRQEKTLSIRLGKVDFNDVAACTIVD